MLSQQFLFCCVDDTILLLIDGLIEPTVLRSKLYTNTIYGVREMHVKRIPVQNGIAKTDKRMLNAKFHYAIHVNASCSATCERPDGVMQFAPSGAIQLVSSLL